jgi:hypothetical protein
MGAKKSKPAAQSTAIILGNDFDQLFTLNMNADRVPIIVGRGAFSAVYLCSRTGRFEQTCAVKHFDLEALYRGVQDGDLDSLQIEKSLTRTRRGLQVR